jgi:hypothetical protein
MLKTTTEQPIEYYAASEDKPVAVGYAKARSNLGRPSNLKKSRLSVTLS